MQWDDLRYILAVHRGGSLAGAGRLLSVSHVTVFRRVEAIENALGVRLFDRKRKGYEATPAGLEIVEQAAKIEEQIKSLESRVWGMDREVKGELRITTTDSFGVVVLPAVVASLRRQYAELRIDMAIVNDLVNLVKRDADIAIRATRSPPEMLIGHKLARLESAVYASESFATHVVKKNDRLSVLPWIGLDESYHSHKISRWLADCGHDKRFALTSNSFLAMASAIQSGIGVGVVSALVARRLGGLVPISPPIPELENDIWILTHPDLRDVARVATPYAAIRSELTQLAPECLVAL